MFFNNVKKLRFAISLGTKYIHDEDQADNINYTKQ